MSFSIACVVCWSDSDFLTPVESENIRNLSIQSMLSELDEYDVSCAACNSVTTTGIFGSRPVLITIRRDFAAFYSV